ncbi:cell wall-binding repeat-containing protein [Zhihengliuella sp.]|uniref:cell wall-binding repeat-containing protein n=1 Tax=Zhihengliuella sp. TaxID=1954483 RepID=UPI002811CE6A|nr:cell wall-binding repeat-containing protein [Zhihengliuella sp.]
MSLTSSAPASGRARVRRTVAAGLLAAALTATAVPAASAAQPAAVPPGVEVDRLGGSNRMKTSVEISKTYFPGGSSVVYLATAHDFADALVAGPAAATEGGPVLLTPAGALDPTVAEEIKRLAPYKVVLVGGEGAVSQTVADSVAGIVGEKAVERVGGDNRYETAANIARSVFPEGAEEAYLATGLDYPDALSAAPLAGALEVPVVLVRGTSTSPDAETVALLDELGIFQASLVGGNGVISAGFQSGLEADGIDTFRYSGKDRYHTNLLVNRELLGISREVMLATGMNYPDALAGAASAGWHATPIYLSRPTCVPAASLKDILHADAGVELVTLLGGEGVLSQKVANLESC